MSIENGLLATVRISTLGRWERKMFTKIPLFSQLLNPACIYCISESNTGQPIKTELIYMHPLFYTEGILRDEARLFLIIHS